MSDTRDREIAELEARILELRRLKSAPEPAGVPDEVGRNPESELPAEISSEFGSDPEPEPSTMYAVSLHPDEAHERVLASGHGVGGHHGLGAAISN